jgi:hypothetical protein
VGQCIDPCTGVICALSETCVSGDCVVLCNGTNCRPGEICEAGQCTPRPRDAAFLDAPIPDAAPPDAPIDAPARDASNGAQDAGGCGCSVGARPQFSPLALLLVLALLRRRRS